MSSDLISQLGWKTQTSLLEGLRLTYLDFVQNIGRTIQ